VLDQKWNAFINSLKAARRAYENMYRYLAAHPEEIDTVPGSVQRVILLWQKTAFDKSLPELVRYWRTHCGLDSLRVNIKSPKKKKPKSKGLGKAT